MITKLNLKQSLVSLGFQPSSSNENLFELYIEKVDSIVKVDFEGEKILYPKGVLADRDTTKNFSKNENFVVLDCVVQLLKIGYRPEHIVLEPKTPGGREDSFHGRKQKLTAVNYSIIIIHIDKHSIYAYLLQIM